MHILEGAAYPSPPGFRVDHGRRSALLGPQTHRLPPLVMWAITFFTASGVALFNFVTIILIRYCVRFKFSSVHAAIHTGGVGMGALALMGVSSLYALVGVCIVELIAPNCGGSGLPEMRCYLNGSRMPGFFTKRTLAARSLSTVFAQGTGFPVGREGPTVTLGANLAFLVSEALARPHVRESVDLSEQGHTHAWLVDEQRFAHATRIACAVGGACSMGCIFNAPLGGLLYMFEEITSVSWPLELTFRMFIATLSSTLMSYGLCWAIHSDIREFILYATLPQTKHWDWKDVPIFIFVSAIMGVVTSLHTRALLAVTSWRQRHAASLRVRRRWSRACETVLYAALCGLVSACVALLGGTCSKVGSGSGIKLRFNCAEGEFNEVISLLATTSDSAVKLLYQGSAAGDIRTASSVLAFLTYFLLNVGLAGLPIPGGAYTVTMLLGGLLGRSVGAICRDFGLAQTVSGVYAIVGSASMLCGFKQMTLSAVLIMVECVNDLALVPLVMLGVAVSITINWQLNRYGHDDDLILRRNLPHLEGEAPEELDRAKAAELCDPLPQEAMLQPETDLGHVKTALDKSQASHFPVRDGAEGPCVGIVAREYLEAALDAAEKRQGSSPGAEQQDVLPLRRIMDPSPFTVSEDMPAPRLYALFAKAGESAVCVASLRGEFRGIISRGGLIEASRGSLQG